MTKSKSRVDLSESRWTAPPEGYFSISEQEDVNRKHQAREMRKVEKIYEQQAIHGKEEEQFAETAAEARDPIQSKKILALVSAWKTTWFLALDSLH